MRDPCSPGPVWPPRTPNGPDVRLVGYYGGMTDSVHCEPRGEVHVKRKRTFLCQSGCGGWRDNTPLFSEGATL